MSHNDTKLIDELDLMIKNGKASLVRPILKGIDIKSIPRDSKIIYASIARRAGEYQWAQNLLAPLVRSSGRRQAAPNTQELLEYGLILLRLGCFHEADQIFSSQLKSSKKAKVFKAYALINQFRYEEALPLLKDSYEQNWESEYFKATVGVNLVSAYSFVLNYESALNLTSVLEKLCSKNKYGLLLGNLLENKIGLLVYLNEYSSARKKLIEAKKLLNDSSLKFVNMLSKWQIALEQLPGRLDLNYLKQAAQEKKQWNLVRSCDLLEALKNKNEDLIIKVLSGSPYSGYRTRVKTLWGNEIEIPDFYFWTESSSSPKKSLDFEKLFNIKPDVPINIVRTLYYLSNDFYSWKSVGTLFSDLYPNEYYSCENSPHRVQMAIYRARSFLESNFSELNIQHNEGTYKMEPSNDTNLKIPTNPDKISLSNQIFEKLLTTFGSRGFKAKEVEVLLDSNKPSTQRKLTELKNQGYIEVIGNGKNTLYKVVRKLKNAG